MDPLRSLTLADVTAELADSYPERISVVDGDVRLTYKQLRDRVRRLATSFDKTGVGAGDRVLWLGQNSFRLLECLLAAAEIGAVFCPANWRQSPAELAFVIDDADPALVIWQRSEVGDTAAQARRLAESTTTWICHDTDGANSYEAFLHAGVPALGRPAPVAPSGAVLQLYTAAFGGTPKGAQLSHAAVLAQNLVVALIQQVGSNTVYLNCGPLFHVAALMTTLSTWHMGGCNVFTPRVDAAELCRLIEAERCTHAFLMPPTMDQMIDVNKHGTYDLTSLRSIPYKPEWNAMVTVDKSPWAKAPGGYGQTELMGLATCNAIGGDAIATHGRPSPVARVRIVDPDGADVPQGETGEIVVRGPLVMVGYHARPDLTAAKQRGGWHHTGDLGRRETDGSITFVGPMTTIIKSAAENIYPVEVENCLARHPDVAEVCVIGVPDPTWGQSVKAVVVLRNGAAASADELIEHCRAHIASYKKPRSVEFTDSLPRTATGAVDRAAVDKAFGGGGYPGASP
jgi:acyl-CoA synthetase (AMP-forming)/AMP-acid ligase II